MIQRLSVLNLIGVPNFALIRPIFPYYTKRLKIYDIVRLCRNKEFTHVKKILAPPFLLLAVLTMATGCGGTPEIKDKHKHDYTQTVTAPTCTTDGYTTYTCDCGDSYTADTVKGAHTPGEAQRQNEREADCTTDGSYDEVVFCTICPAELSRKTEPVSATGHTFSTDWTYDATRHWHAATCGHEEVSATANHTLQDNVCTVCSYKAPVYTDGLQFALVENTYTVTGYTGTSTDVVIPVTYNGKPVTAIGREAFSGMSTLTSVIIPEGVTTLDFQAFYGCFDLAYIVIPSTVTHIGEFAFRFCVSLDVVYYGGTQTTWANVMIESSNDELAAPKRLYYAKEKPTNGEGWYYKDDKPVAW